MLLKSIKLQNFRQFVNETIEFADGKDGKNVTIILGENGTGKTTFAQAFFWCMYGETEFSDKKMINKEKAAQLRPGQEEKVLVELNLRHGDVDYTLIREQTYKKDYSNNIKADNTIFDIAVKDASGITTYVKKSQCEGEVKGILPKELSRYFFFDGERIEKMSKDISSHKKSDDFAEAVKGLLGLNAMISAIGHFNPNSKNGVIRSYSDSFDSSSNARITQYTNTINECNEKLAFCEQRLEELGSEIEVARQKLSDKTLEIKQYEEGEKLQSQREKLLKDIDSIKKTKSNVYKSICSDFNNQRVPFFSKSLIKRALELLAQEDIVGKDIPYMHTKTIEYLLKQGTCICGTHLDEGSTPFMKVKELENYLPPQSISTSVSDFKKEALNRIKELPENEVESINDYMAVLSQHDDEMLDKQDDLSAIEAKLSGDDVREKVKALNAEINMWHQNINKAEKEKTQRTEEKGRLLNERERADSERRNLTLLDDKNKKVEIYKAYAEKVYQELLAEYNASEEIIRSKLQDTINEIFKTIYNGGLYLEIDEKYHISVYADQYEGDDVETSTAQSISVIFAFITGIIRMARENNSSSDESAKLLSSEPYPLVMDAPLSAFDKRRIKAICESLPETAEQVIIFIKDTDGELAEEYMGTRIGKRMTFDKKSEFITELV